MPARTAPSVEAEVLHRLDGVVVAVPDRDVALGEAVARPPPGSCPWTLKQKVGTRPSIVRSPYSSMLAGRPARKRSPSSRSWETIASQPSDVDVVDRRHEAGEQLVLARPELEAVADGVVRRGPHLVRPPRLEQLALAEREPHVRPEELVGRADEHVDVPRGDVDRPVRPVVHRVGPCERTGAVGEVDDAADVRRRSRPSSRRPGTPTTRVRSESLDSRSVVVHLELAREARHPDDDPEVVGQLEPRRDVPVVVERRDDDLVALAQRPPERAA